MIEFRKRHLVRVANGLVGVRVGGGRRCKVTAALPLGPGEADNQESMPHRHFSVVREALEAIKAEDQDAAEKVFDPEAEWHNTAAFPGERVCKGPSAIIAFWRTLTDAFHEGGHEIEQYAEREDRAVVGFHTWSSGKASGAPVDVRWAAIFELRSQRVARVDVYGSYARAIQAVESRAWPSQSSRPDSPLERHH